MTKKYEIVEKDLMDKITQGIYAEGSMLPTETEMIEYYDVSRITIQRAMQNLVSKNIIERIAGKGTFLKGKINHFYPEKRSNFYSFIMPCEDTEMLNLINSVQTVFSSKGQNLTVHFNNKDASKDTEIIDKIIKDGSKGVIIYMYASDMNFDYYFKLQKNGFPIVFIDKFVTGLTSNVVMSNNFQGAYDETQYLINMGHRKIAYLSKNGFRANSLRERLRGFSYCLKDNNIPFDRTLVYLDFSSPDTLNELFSRHKDITAIVCAFDEIAFYVYLWLMEKGIRIPDDISVCGFDDANIAKPLLPSLTTVAQSFSEMGTKAAEMLYDMSQNNNKNLSVIYMPTKLIERNSVKNLNVRNHSSESIT